MSQRPAYTGIIEPRSTLQEFNPNQRSTPRHQSLGVERTRNNYLPRESVPVSQSFFHQSSAQVPETTFRHPSSNVEFLNRYRQSGAAVQFRQLFDNQCTHQHAGSVPALQYTRRGHPSAPMDRVGIECVNWIQQTVFLDSGIQFSRRRRQRWHTQPKSIGSPPSRIQRITGVLWKSRGLAVIFLHV